MATYAKAPDTKAISAQPIADINTTPLIDVMLVLLIMFVITIPAATNTTPIDLPGDDGEVLPVPDEVKNRLVLTADDRILWNGHALSRPELAALLRQTAQMPVEPKLQFDPDAAASYDLSARVLATIKASGVTRFGFVGNERHADFGK